MPRRKRTPDESGRRAKVSKVDHNEETLVISDSEQEEEDSPIKRSSRTARWRRRENKSQLQELTEDEMLDLALKLSAQEANSVAQRRRLEDKDIQKAIAESLNESTVKASEGQDEAASSSDQPQQNVANAISHLRRKLSYPSQDQTNRKNERETTSPLPEMPDLSPMASSHLSSKSSAQVSRTPATTQDKTSDKQTVISDTPEDELFKSLSESQTSPVFSRHGSFDRQPVVCVEKLSQELIPASAGSINFHTQDSTVISTCPDRFRSPQQDSPFSKWPVFTQGDFKRSSNLLEDKDDHQNAKGNEDDTQIPAEDTHLPTQLSQGLSTDPDTCLSPSKRSQISSPKCVPVKNNEDVTETSKTPDQKQVEDQTPQGENVKSDTDDDDDDEDDGSEEVLSPSPVKKIFRPIRTELSPNQSCISSTTITLDPSTQDTQMSRSVLEEDSRASKATESKPTDCKPQHTSVEKGQCTISYYWGVPFCPVGQNPDEYTRVIMCQMEVYEKSLKEAQRELLRKADWGQPVCPRSSERQFGGRRWKRHRAPQLSEDEEENEEEGEKENNRIEVEEERDKAGQESVVGSQEEAEGGQTETYVVLSSPETKDEQVEKTPFSSQEEPATAAANKSFRKNAPWDISDETQIKCPAEQEEQEAQTHEGCEEDDIVCPETQMTENSTPELMMTSPASPAQPQSHADSEVMEVEEGGGASVAVEEMMEQECDPTEAAPPHSQRMECPMCSKLFPLSRIEVHAAFCDGEADQQEEQSQVVARRRRTRGNLTEESQQSGKSAEMEKCFLCQELFSPQEYPDHVKLCFKKKDSKTNEENGLLSALERTERRHTGSDEPGPSDVSTKSNCGLANPAVIGMSESVDCSATTSCPSNAFTPRSENTDCLIDSSKNSLRLSRKRKFKR
ncbi:BRCA1-A complex subunit RAP80 isoform X3 [Ctenopharyngodon idella]|uniref:BRCA1-A complex subunit RAP80 isoform X3 n=1 Tax=Ctenopharyngodon idella TaxID=7959 RepID=UPI002230C217|nr:BRCA1-A complex subunit RAP80 isoform X3 [Ctenopharyngodon idella]